MSTYNFNYLYEKDFKKQLISALSKPAEQFDKVSTYEVENATILPSKPNTDPSVVAPWGMGGVLDQEKQFVDASGVVRAFGGKYDFSDEEVEELDEEVIHINIIPRHWGHFLVDVVCRLWYIIEQVHDERKITYCGWKLDEDGIGGNYLAFFEKLGISRERLIYVKRPLHVRKVIIPDRTFEYSGRYHQKYFDTIQLLVDNIISEDNDESENYSELVYLTRTQLKKSKYYDTGEKEIEEAFRNNGYKIVATEKMTLEQQVKMFQHAKVVASLSGTLPHNIIFTAKNTEFIILKRACAVLPPQVGFNNLFDRQITYIDAYNPLVIKDGASHGDGPFWVECNKNVTSFLRSRGYSYYEELSRKPTVWIRNWLMYNGLKITRKAYGMIRR